MKQIITLVFAMLMTSTLQGQEEAKEKKAIDWRKVKVDCTRRMKKSKVRTRNGGENKRQEVTVTCTIRNGMKEAVSGLTLHMYILNRTVADNRRNRKVVQGEDNETKGIKVEHNEKKVIEGIKCTIVEKLEIEDYWQNGEHQSRARKGGEEYYGYVAILKDSEGKIILVKADTSRTRKAAYELKILPEKLKLDYKGMVIPPKEK